MLVVDGDPRQTLVGTLPKAEILKALVPYPGSLESLALRLVRHGCCRVRRKTNEGRVVEHVYSG